MIKVNYHPLDGETRTAEANTLTEWFLDVFGPDLLVPAGLRITLDGVSSGHDVTHEIANNDANGHLTRSEGVYHVLEVPAGPETWVPLLISAVVSAAAVLLTPTPSVSVDPNITNRRQESSTNSLGDRTNEARPKQRAQDVRGFEPAVYYDLIMEPHRRYENNKEVEYTYMCVSAGQVELSDVRDGITPFTNIDEASFEAYNPGTSPNSGDSPFFSIGDPITFPVVAAGKSRNVTGQELAPSNRLSVVGVTITCNSSGLITLVDPDESLDLTTIYTAGDSVTLEDFYSFRFNRVVETTSPDAQRDGYDRFNLSGTYTLTSVTSSTLTVNTSGRPEWSYFGSGFTLRTITWRFASGDDLDVYMFETSGRKLVTQSYSPTFSGVSVPTVGPFRLQDGSVSGWVNLLALNGIYKAGTTDESYSVTVQFTLYEVSSTGVRTGNSTPLTPVTLTSNPSNISEQVGTTQDFTVPYAFCEIEGIRTSDTDKSFEGTVFDEVTWDALYYVEDIGTWTAPEELTTAYSRIVQNTTASAVEERKINSGVKRYERRYLGNGQMSSTQDTPSDEFADAVVGLALDPYVGKTITIDQLNVDSLYAVQEEIAEYFGTRNAVKFGYAFSDTKITFEEHLQTIAQAVFCKVFRVGNTYEFRFVRPKAQGETALLLNHRLKYQGTDKRTRRFTDQDNKGYDGVIVTYKDADSLAYETVYVPDSTEPVVPLEVELSGVIYEQVAEWHAWREWNKIKYKRLFHSTEAHSLARGLVPDDRIQMANDTSTKAQGGQVLEQSGLNLRLQNGTRIEEGETYSITLLYSSGTVENILCTSSPNGENWVLLFALPSEDIYTGNLKWKTTYNLYEQAEQDSDDMLVETMSVSIKNGQERVTVNAINYDDRYWQNDPQEVSTGSFSTAFNDSFDKGQ